MPGTPEFDEEYRMAMAGEILPAPSKEVIIPGSFRDLCVRYYGSGMFARLDARTQYVRRGVLDGLSERCGSFQVATIMPKHVLALRDSKEGKPEAGNGILKALRQLFSYGVQVGMLGKNPAADVSYIPSSGTGFHSWTPEEIQKFEQAHPVGSQARLALALLLYTGQRRSDVVRFGMKDTREGFLTFTQVKNGKKKPVTLTLPLFPELLRIIDATPGAMEGETFILNAYGKPYTAESFGNRFRDWCNEAGLPHCASHGLRKAAAVRLAELGCTAHEIAAVTGHRSLKEVQRYTLAADQKRLAASAFARMQGHQMSHNNAENAEWDEKRPKLIEIKGGRNEMVPKTGIEPVTLRFSVACSTN
ncbi:hypothetical protein ASY01nite_22160 [Acetobacter syzygii]|nr:integrase [Acetobacter syzygii]GEL57150.1 hypothetical protein ASY01nite_22160 [Acetobacter syzygii]